MKTKESGHDEILWNSWNFSNITGMSVEIIWTRCWIVNLDESRRVCMPCPAQCKKCNSLLECTECESRLMLEEGRCVASCLHGHFRTDDYECLPCSSSCSSCSGNADHCVTCADSYLEFNQTCVEACPPGFRNETSRNQCLPCPRGCEMCSSQELGLVCSKCTLPWLLDTSTQQCINPSSNTCSTGNTNPFWFTSFPSVQLLAFRWIFRWGEMHQVPRILSSVCRTFGNWLHGMLLGNELDDGRRIVFRVLSTGHFQWDWIPTFQSVAAVHAVPVGLRSVWRSGSLYRMFGRITSSRWILPG